MGFEGILGPDPSPTQTQTQTFLSAESKPKLVGSGFTKQERFSVSAEEDHWKSCKLPGTDDSSMPMHQGSYGNFIGVDGAFTPSQWNELKQQTLIYKYIIADVLVPSNLLIPLKKSIYPYGFTSSSTASSPYNSLGWGSFHLRYTGKFEPEPGRCRRTDGKKWRCSWDVVPRQKYCERHINRGRHRSRKPVEGHTASTANSKLLPISSSMSASVKTSGGAPNNLAIPWQHQFKNLQFGAVNPSPDTLVNRVEDQRRLWVLSSTTKLKPKESRFSITKQCAESCFGHSLINPSHRSYYMNSKESGLHIDFTAQSIDSVITWSDELKSDRIRTIPMATSSSSTTKHKLDLSSLKLCPEFNPIQMGLAVNTDQTKKQANWISESLGTSIGGPLGEALNNSSTLAL